MYDIVMYKMIPAFLHELKLELKNGLNHWKTLFLDYPVVEVAHSFLH